MTYARRVDGPHKLVMQTRYGRLVVQEIRRGDTDHPGRQAISVCDCGKTYQCRLTALVSGKNRSCGCLARERIGALKRKQKISKACLECGVVMLINKSLEPTKSYCSMGCMAAGYRKRFAGRTLRPRQFVTVRCAGCGVDFSHPRCDKTRIFCSRRCYFNEQVRRVSMGRITRIDANQVEIVAALRAYGAAVMDASPLGKGFPDLIVAYRGNVHLIEVKNPHSQYGRAGLNKNQKKFIDAGWIVSVVTSVDEAIAAIQATAR